MEFVNINTMFPFLLANCFITIISIDIFGNIYAL